MESAKIDEAQPRMYIPVGCPKCDKSGYLGRIGVYEMLVFDEALSEAVRSGASLAEIRRMAQANGMRSLEEDALLKVKLGMTSLEEAMRVISFKNVIFGGLKVERGEESRA